MSYPTRQQARCLAIIITTIAAVFQQTAAETRRPSSLLVDEASLMAALEDDLALQMGKRADVSDKSASFGSLWFGPRLGRRRRSPSQHDEEEMSPEEEAYRMEALAKLMKESPWAFVAFRELPSGKRQTLSFTPRLGRAQDYGEIPNAVYGTEFRTPPFSPRLGRGNGLPFSPRLGRQESMERARRSRSPGVIMSTTSSKQ